MTNGRVEIITSVQRRRRWRPAEKEQLVAASLEAGASVSAVAREAASAGSSNSSGSKSRRSVCFARRAMITSRRAGRSVDR